MEKCTIRIKVFFKYLSFGKFMKQKTGYRRSSGMLRGVDWWLFTEIWGRPVSPISKGEAT
jgi:hypothetical protein